MTIGKLTKLHAPTILFETDEKKGYMINISKYHRDATAPFFTCSIIRPDIKDWLRMYVKDGYKGMIRTK